MQEKEKKKLPGEEARFMNLAGRLARQMGLSVKNFKIFGERHPVVANSVQNAHELLKTIFAERNSITYTLLEGTLIAEDSQLKDLDSVVYSLMTELVECGITSLTFLNGVTKDEIALLLRFISSGPLPIKAEGGLASIFKSKNISHIKADEIFFKRISRSEEETQRAKDRLTDVLIMDYLAGGSSFLKNDMEALKKEINANPRKIGEIVSKVVLSAGGGGGDAGDSAEFAYGSIEKLLTGMRGAGGTAADLNESAKNLIMALEPRLRNGVLAVAASSEGSEDVIKDVIAGLSDKVIVDVIESDFVDGHSSITEERQFIRKMLPDEVKRKRVFPLLEKRLLQRGVSQIVCSKLLEGKFWADMDNEEKLKSIEENEPLYCAEIGVSSEIKKFVRDLAAEGDFDSARKVLDKTLDNLSSDKVDLKIRLVRDFEDIAVMLFQSADYPHKGTFLERIVKESGKAKEKEVRERFAKLFVSLANVCVRSSQYAFLPLLIRSAGLELMRREIFPETALEAFLSSLIFNEKTSSGLIRDISREFGADAQDALCRILLSIESEEFDSYRERYEIASIVSGCGPFPEAFFIGKLSSGKGREAEISLEVLSEFGTERSISAIEKLLNHQNTRMKKLAELAIRNIKKRSS